MTPPHHGSDRTEVRDLRNIVDRLDVMMDAAGTSSRAAGGGRETTEEVVERLADRVEQLQSEVEELRALIDHLMTIATWQARVTATLVEDRAPEDDAVAVDDDDAEIAVVTSAERARDDAASGRARDDHASATEPIVALRHDDADRRREREHERDRDRGDDRDRRHDRPAPARVATTLDEDIDDILGTKRRSRRREAPPPDFGI